MLASAGLGVLPVHQFGSYYAVHVVREARLYGARPYALHATHVKGRGVVFKRNNAVTLGRCRDAHLCLGRRAVRTETVKAYALRDAGLWRHTNPH